MERARELSSPPSAPHRPRPPGGTGDKNQFEPRNECAGQSRSRRARAAAGTAEAALHDPPGQLGRGSRGPSRGDPARKPLPAPA